MIMMTYLRIEGKGPSEGRGGGRTNYEESNDSRVEGKGPSEGRGGWRICGNQEGDDLRVVYDGMMH
jgi:hypothetical protein